MGAGVRSAVVVIGVLGIVLAAAAPAAGQPCMVVDLRPAGFENSYAQAGANGKQVGSGQGPASGGAPHALLWSGTAASKVDLHPAGYYQSYLYGTDGAQQVGYGVGPAPTTERHAMVWSGTAASAVDLHPAGFTVSDAYGVREGRQVGVARGPNTADQPHALLWSGTAASAVDLHPSGAAHSFARAIGGPGGAVQAGSANFHAGTWSGTAASFVDLHPPGYGSSDLYATTGIRHAGTVTVGDDAHAAFWPSSSPLGVVDLHPAGFTFSLVQGMNAEQQVGIAVIAATGQEHAMLWSGSAASAVDLHELLPPALRVGRSIAYGIDEQGNVFGRVSAPDGDHAILWAVPEPGSTSVIATAAALALLGRRLARGQNA